MCFTVSEVYLALPTTGYENDLIRQYSDECLNFCE